MAGCARRLCEPDGLQTIRLIFMIRYALLKMTEHIKIILILSLQKLILLSHKNRIFRNDKTQRLVCEVLKRCSRNKMSKSAITRWPSINTSVTALLPEVLGLVLRTMNSVLAEFGLLWEEDAALDPFTVKYKQNIKLVLNAKLLKVVAAMKRLISKNVCYTCI